MNNNTTISSRCTPFLMSLYAIGVLLIIGVDRFTKVWAVTTLKYWPKYINKYLTYQLAYNRGVSWSFLSSDVPYEFAAVSFLVVTVTALLTWYAYTRCCDGYTVFGEIFVIAGSLSNVIDRAMYGGVVDFILLSYEGYSWPVFNIADIFIVAGVLWMVLTGWDSKPVSSREY